MFPLLASPRNLAILVLAIAVAGLSVTVWVQRGQVKSAKAIAVLQQNRADTLADEVTQANQAVIETAAINGRLNQAIEVHRQAGAALQARLAEHEAKAVERDRIVREATAQARQRDRERRGRAGLPPAEEMATALREAVQGL